MSLDSLCGLFGLTRQGLWKQRRSTYSEEIDNTAVISEVRLIRKDMPRLGARKLQIKLAEKGHDIGRDRLFDLLRESGHVLDGEGLVASHVGAWIEMVFVPDGDEPAGGSHPTWVRGLKSILAFVQLCFLRSHPTWVRGLKS